MNHLVKVRDCSREEEGKAHTEKSQSQSNSIKLGWLFEEVVVVVCFPADAGGEFAVEIYTELEYAGEDKWMDEK
jgi:hypothetical protein